MGIYNSSLNSYWKSQKNLKLIKNKDKGQHFLHLFIYEERKKTKFKNSKQIFFPKEKSGNYLDYENFDNEYLQK